MVYIIKIYLFLVRNWFIVVSHFVRLCVEYTPSARNYGTVGARHLAPSS